MKIIDYIPQGATNSVPMKELSARTGLTPREVRQAIFNARKAGEPICSSCDEDGGGYFLPDCVSDCTPYIRSQKARIKSANIALAAVENYVEQNGGE